MQRVLVTGASGLIGRHVAEELARRGFDVHGCARTWAPIAGVSMHSCDLLDAHPTGALVRTVKPDIIVHSAWVTTHGVYWQSPENRDWLTASLSLLGAANDSGVRRFVGVGTCAEYDPAELRPRHETRSVIAPSTPYGATKDEFRRAAEQLANTEGVEFAWARVFMLYGAGEHPDRFVASLARALVSGQPALTSSGTAVRDFFDARDVGGAIAALAASHLTGALNIGSGNGVSLREIGERLANSAGHPELLAVGAIPDRPGEPKSLVADVTRLRDELGFRPAITLDRGLADALDYWRERRLTAREI
jgi:nucleoside-diphosphate-sugar epimerase